MISSKKYVDETLKKYNLKANKALGQNFLVDEVIVENIVRETKEVDAYIEIGPGLGALTEKLVETQKNVYAFEIDENMVNILSNTFKNYKNLKLYNQDILKVDLDIFVADKEERIAVISNLPYYITSQILTKVLIINDKIDTIVTMMQKEVGKKLLSNNEKSFLTYLMKYKYDVTAITHVSKNSFLPRPEIDSIVLQFKKKPASYKIINEDAFYQFLRQILQNKRKTLTNNLQPYFSSKEEIIKFLVQLNVSSLARIEELTFDTVVAIYKELLEK